MSGKQSKLNSFFMLEKVVLKSPMSTYSIYKVSHEAIFSILPSKRLVRLNLCLDKNKIM